MKLQLISQDSIDIIKSNLEIWKTRCGRRYMARRKARGNAIFAHVL